MIKNLYKEGYTQNRELSWLRFDDRCLNEAKDKHNPELERMKFVSIYTSNLTEFFRVRVGGLYDMAQANVTKVDNKSGLTPKQQLSEIYRVAKRGCKKRDEIYEELRGKMARHGIEDLYINECTKAELKFLKKYFKNQIEPLLTPQIVDPRHPFPNLQNETTYIASVLKTKGHGIVGFVQVPEKLPTVIVLPTEGKLRFVHTGDVILWQVESIFKGMTPGETLKLSVARSAYVDPEDETFDDIVDYRKKMLKVLKERRKMNITRLVVSQKPSQNFKKYLFEHMNITQQMMFVCTAPMNMKYVFSLEGLLPDELKKKFCYPAFTPKLSPSLDYTHKLFPQILKKDVFLSYPYESIDPFLQLLKESANDPNVVSIKITFYRIARHARMVEYLCMAAENGKQVDVLMELKARFDEQNNIDYSERLEDAGCNVTYGFDNYKVHSKICLITRVEKGKTQHVALVSTGNFNENTAKQYTDFAYLTARPSITKDAVAFFQNMWIGNLEGNYKSLLVAPVSLKTTLLELMDREIEKKEKGVIFVKLNSVTDEELIAKLCEASKAGVKVRMLVRGISCILPSISKKTVNIEIRSIVGRYLEHSRIYLFGSGKDEKLYISSADFMTRNTERRVEVACPILDADIRKRIHDYIEVCWKDNVKARELEANGRYHKLPIEEDEFISQDYLMETTVASKQSLRKSTNERPTTVFHGTVKKGKKKK